MMNKSILSFILLLTVCFSNVNYTASACSGADIVKYYFYDNGTGNTTTSADITTCAYGCDANSNTCKDIAVDANYGYMFIFGIAVVIFALLYLSSLLGNQNDVIKTLLVMIALLLLAGILFGVSIFGNYYNNTFIGGISNLASTLGYSIGMIFTFMLFKLVFVDLIPMLLKAVRPADKK